MDKTFSNIEVAIKRAAIVILIIGGVVWALWGIDVFESDMQGMQVLWVFCGIGIWAESIFLYGFGVLIEKINKIEKNISHEESVKEKDI